MFSIHRKSINSLCLLLPLLGSTTGVPLSASLLSPPTSQVNGCVCTPSKLSITGLALFTTLYLMGSTSDVWVDNDFMQDTPPLPRQLQGLNANFETSVHESVNDLPSIGVLDPDNIHLSFQDIDQKDLLPKTHFFPEKNLDKMQEVFENLDWEKGDLQIIGVSGHIKTGEKEGEKPVFSNAHMSLKKDNSASSSYDRHERKEGWDSSSSENNFSADLYTDSEDEMRPRFSYEEWNKLNNTLTYDEFVEKLGKNLGPETNVSEVLDFIERAVDIDTIKAPYVNQSVHHIWIKSIQNKLFREGVEQMNETQIEAVYNKSGGDNALFVHILLEDWLIHVLQSKNMRDQFPNEEFYNFLVDRLLHTAHETFRRELLSLKFSVYVDIPFIWSGDVTVDFTPAAEWIEDVVEAIYDVAKSIVDAALAAYKLVRSVIDACTTCDERVEQTFVNYFADTFLPFLFSFFAACFCCVFCYSGQKAQDGVCYAAAECIKETRGLACSAMAYVLGGFSCIFFCFAKCNDPCKDRCKRCDCLRNKCIANLSRCFMYIFLFPAMCCMCFSDGNYGLDTLCPNKCESNGKKCRKCLNCCILCSNESNGGDSERDKVKKKCGKTYRVTRNCTLHLLVWGLLGFGLYELFAPGDDFSGSLGDLFRDTYNDFLDNFDDGTPAPTPQPNIFGDLVFQGGLFGNPDTR